MVTMHLGAPEEGCPTLYILRDSVEDRLSAQQRRDVEALGRLCVGVEVTTGDDLPFYAPAWTVLDLM